jgi:hypothetical protein
MTLTPGEHTNVQDRMMGYPRKQRKFDFLNQYPESYFGNICALVFLHLISCSKGVRVHTVGPNGLYSCFFTSHKQLNVIVI